MKVLPKKMDLVRFIWKDSNFAKGWIHKEDKTASLPLVTSIGWVVFVDKDILETCSHIGDEGGKLNPLSVPWSSIIKLEKI